MVRAKGQLSQHKPRISTKTPTGRKIEQKTTKGYEIEFELIESSKDGDTNQVNEKLSLEVSSINRNYIKLKNIPSYLRNSVQRHADGAVYDIHSITNNGRVIESFEPSQQHYSSSPSESQETVIDSPTDIDYTGPPSRELLESITANVLDSLGYDTETNASRTTREGPEAEVDVWAENPRENFSIYASCKNWDSKVGRPTVDEEVGRVINLRKVPQLRVLVVGNLTKDAEKALEASGFLAVKLGEQADDDNTEEIYREIHSQLTETLLAIAPPRVEEIANRAEALSRELGELSDDIRRIGD
jgi:hypothetical protein